MATPNDLVEYLKTLPLMNSEADGKTVHLMPFGPQKELFWPCYDGNGKALETYDLYLCIGPMQNNYVIAIDPELEGVLEKIKAAVAEANENGHWVASDFIVFRQDHAAHAA